jgi:hypothetical protein
LPAKVSPHCLSRLLPAAPAGLHACHQRLLHNLQLSQGPFCVLSLKLLLHGGFGSQLLV